MSSGSGSNVICRRICAASSRWTTATQISTSNTLNYWGTPLLEHKQVVAQTSVEAPPSLRSVLALLFVGYVLFVTVISAFRNYFAVVDQFGDNYTYMAIASAIRSWDF